MPLSSLFDLTGQTAIVTGGASGIGLQMASGLAEAGANIVLCARHLDRCEAVGRELAADTGVRVLALRCDVQEEAEVKSVVDTTMAELGRIDILVNNAGTSWGAPAIDYPVAGWRKVIDVNLTGAFLFTQATGRTMIDRGAGRIINIVSVAALIGSAPGVMDAIGYTASKGGLMALTVDLAVKWAPHGIRVNAIAPGWFPTDMSKVLLERDPELYRSRIPLGRFGGPEDLKGVVVLLASEASAFMTGQTIVVDGGQTIS
jgi:NAD(P)-dependent dehydrogenase (short-subunit alcohol dehydrogenase family)